VGDASERAAAVNRSRLLTSYVGSHGLESWSGRGPVCPNVMVPLQQFPLDQINDAEPSSLSGGATKPCHGLEFAAPGARPRD
jgi:hypothetical protein